MKKIRKVEVGRKKEKKSNLITCLSFYLRVLEAGWLVIINFAQKHDHDQCYIIITTI